MRTINNRIIIRNLPKRFKRKARKNSKNLSKEEDPRETVKEEAESSIVTA